MGSPPRGRGKVTRRKRTRTKAGITPAWAGKSHAVHSPSHGAGDHPRVGGEKPRKPTMSRKRHRITPAWAGKRCRYGVCAHRGRDHPRVGGEKCPLVSLAIFGWGSPPRGRGKVSFTFWIILHSGITPAWAGKRHINVYKVCVSEDHPRVGGEKSRVAPRSDPGTGSPPRGRGKDRRKPQIRGRKRITPAWAGKSHSILVFAPVSRDHPRVGGEKRHLDILRLHRLGSPPRGRGKEVKDLREAIQMRITPAWAGKRH